eukprot:TRINITY_DN4027_c0_g1_i2.p1 TRINITY_DN4027_c0_g1~~TRINITY_DN4027_c0_g1_i2.p1  ORF type:complete len:271 (+),score=64.60 TRINITY_DN4027_c0_g1_i2:155-967(+)
MEHPDPKTSNSFSVQLFVRTLDQSWSHLFDPDPSILSASVRVCRISRRTDTHKINLHLWKSKTQISKQIKKNQEDFELAVHLKLTLNGKYYSANVFFNIYNATKKEQNGYPEVSLNFDGFAPAEDVPQETIIDAELVHPMQIKRILNAIATELDPIRQMPSQPDLVDRTESVIPLSDRTRVDADPNEGITNQATEILDPIITSTSEASPTEPTIIPEMNDLAPIQHASASPSVVHTQMDAFEALVEAGASRSQEMEGSDASSTLLLLSQR